MVQGMNGVVATVSGYHGSERFNLIKLISHAGASYVGAMSKSTTHLVCWKFQGRKHDLARKFNILIVNHKWIEDSLKAGKRLPEHPYIFQSGEEVGPLTTEVPVVAKKTFDPVAKDRRLSFQSNACDLYKEPVIDLECESDHRSSWIDSSLSNEDLFSELGASRSDLLRLKKKRVRNTFKKEPLPNSRYGYQTLPLSALATAEKREKSTSYLSKHSVRHKTSTCEDLRRTSSDVPQRKGRRLVKGNGTRGSRNFGFPESNIECSPVRVSKSNDVSERNENVSVSLGASSNSDFLESRESEHSSEAEKSNEQMEDGSPLECSIRLRTSTELSCVICWTDFSSVRGILPCGHRFCYSCIESWADHMASAKKDAACPLCKASFYSIRKVDDVSSLDQKIYSQTIPQGSSEKDVLVCGVEIPNLRTQSSTSPVCCKCLGREPVDLLVSCHLCQIQLVHSYCLDPPLFPWTCGHCREFRMLYQHLR